MRVSRLTWIIHYKLTANLVGALEKLKWSKKK